MTMTNRSLSADWRDASYARSGPMPIRPEALAALPELVGITAESRERCNQISPQSAKRGQSSLTLTGGAPILTIFSNHLALIQLGSIRLNLGRFGARILQILRP